jgi:hypothetical protein
VVSQLHEHVKVPVHRYYRSEFLGKKADGGFFISVILVMPEALQEGNGCGFDETLRLFEKFRSFGGQEIYENRRKVEVTSVLMT